MACACAALWRRTYSLKEETSSSLEMDWDGVKRPDPLNAIPVTDGTLLDLRRETGPAAAQIQGYWNGPPLPLRKRPWCSAKQLWFSSPADRIPPPAWPGRSIAS